MATQSEILGLLATGKLTIAEATAQLDALKPQQSRLNNSTGEMSESKLTPPARAAVSSWSALNRPNTSSVAVMKPIGSA